MANVKWFTVNHEGNKNIEYNYCVDNKCFPSCLVKFAKEIQPAISKERCDGGRMESCWEVACDVAPH